MRKRHLVTLFLLLLVALCTRPYFPFANFVFSLLPC